MQASVSKRTRNIRLALFTAVYFAEGAILTYSSSFSILYLRKYNLSYSLIGIVSAISLIPFILKIFIGLLSDRVNLFHRGHRKPYIIIGLCLQALAFLLLPLFPPDTQFPLYLTLIILASLGMSTYDTTTDGLSIDTTPEADRGLVQGLMVGGRACSGVIVAILMGIFSNQNKWEWNFLLIAGLALVTLILAFMVEDNAVRPAETEYSKDAFRSFTKKSFLLFVLLGFIYPLALYSTETMVSAFLNEGMGISLATVGVYTSVFGVGTIAGGLTGGPLMKKIGKRSSVLVALFITAAVTFILAVTPTPGLMWVVVFLVGFAFGYYETVYFAMGMDYSDPRIAAFMFACVMAVGNVGIALGSAVGGALVDSVGFRLTFAIFGVVHLLALPVVFAIFKTQQKRVKEAVYADRAS